MFKELPEGETHSFNDGCGEPEHNQKDFCEKCYKYINGFPPMCLNAICPCDCHQKSSDKIITEDMVLEAAKKSNEMQRDLMEKYNKSKDIWEEFDKEFGDWKCKGCKRSYEGDKRHRSNPGGYCDVLMKEFIQQHFFSKEEVEDLLEEIVGKEKLIDYNIGSEFATPRDYRDMGYDSKRQEIINKIEEWRKLK